MLKKTLLIAIMLVGCGPSMTIMVQPNTGERVICRAAMDGSGSYVIGQGPREDCINEFTALGFVPASQLTEKQRAALNTR